MVILSPVVLLQNFLYPKKRSWLKSNLKRFEVAQLTYSTCQKNVLVMKRKVAPLMSGDPKPFVTRVVPQDTEFLEIMKCHWSCRKRCYHS